MARSKVVEHTPVVTVGPTMASLDAQCKTGKVRHGDLSRHLATIKAFYLAFGQVPAEYQGAINAPVPVDIITIIGKILAGPEGWAADENEAKTQAANERNLRLWDAAEKIRKQHPRFKDNDTWVADKIWNDPAMKVVIAVYDKNGTARKILSVDYIRKIISKPPK